MNTTLSPNGQNNGHHPPAVSRETAGHSNELAMRDHSAFDDDFLILDTRAANGVAAREEKTRINAIATISGGYRGEDNRPNRSKDGEIYIHGEAPGLAAALAERGGKSLTIMFPSDNPRDFIQQCFAEYTASALKTYGDQNSVTEINGENRVVHLAGTPEYSRAIAKCKVSVSVYFLLAEWVPGGADMVFHDGLGMYRLRFTSSNSLRSILFSVQHMKKMTGGKIAGIPFDLFLRQEEHADPTGKKRAVWIWQAIPRPPQGVRFTATEFRQFADYGQQQLSLLQLEAPAAETLETAMADARIEDVSIEDASIQDAQIVEEDEVVAPTAQTGSTPAASAPALICDAAEMRARYFAIAQGTRFSEKDGRAEFIGELTGGTITSLAKFLEIATDVHAQEMLEELSRAIAMERDDEAANAAARDQSPRVSGEQIKEYSELTKKCVDAGLGEPKPLLETDSQATAESRIKKVRAALTKKQEENRTKLANASPRAATKTISEAALEKGRASATSENAAEAEELFGGDDGASSTAAAQNAGEVSPFSVPIQNAMAAAQKAGFVHGGDPAFPALIAAINAKQKDLFLKKPITTLEGMADVSAALVTSHLETGRMLP